MKRGGIFFLIMMVLFGTIGSEAVFAAPKLSETATFRPILTWCGDPAATQAVAWDAADAGVLQYRKSGSDDAFKTVSPERTPETEGFDPHWEVKLTGLQPGTQYEYRLKTKRGTSESHTFCTAKADPDSVSVLLLGDVQFDVREEDYPIWGTLLRAAYERHPELDFALMTGDYVNTPESKKDWDCYFKEASTVFSALPVMTAPGNHETHYLPYSYLNRFALPENGPDGGLEEFYSFHYGSCHFISMNSCVFLPERKEFEGSTNWNDLIARIDAWLKADLKANTRPWIVVALHHPPYGIEEDSDLYEQIRTHWVPLWEAGGVQLVVCGHQHVYMRTEEQNGVTYVMSNSGQKRSHYYDADALPDYVEKVEAECSVYGILYADRDTLKLNVYDPDGKAVDAWVYGQENRDGGYRIRDWKSNKAIGAAVLLLALLGLRKGGTALRRKTMK